MWWRPEFKQKTSRAQWLKYAALWAAIIVCILLVYAIFGLDKYTFTGKGAPRATDANYLLSRR